MNLKNVKIGLIVLACFAMAIPLKAQIMWQQVEPGVWKGIVGQPEKYSLLEVAGCTPKKDGFTRLPQVELPELASQIVGEILDGKTSLRIPLQRKEQLYGFGLNFQTVHQRGKILNLHVDHYGGKDNGRTHAPVPFYVSSEGYGVLINSARYITVYAGSGSRKDSPEAPVAKDRNTDRTWSSRPIQMLFHYWSQREELKYIFLEDLLQWMLFADIIYCVEAVIYLHVGD
jgi:alpha-D-xyloside xylohydrolase